MVVTTSELIRNRYEKVREQITLSAQRAGRNINDIKLIVVTKGHSEDITRKVIEAGAKAIGENYPEKALPKIASLSNYDVEWHMIGHVQSRKASIVVGNFDLVHSLDSVKLAVKYEQQCRLTRIKLPVLLEFNLSAEASKSGFPAWEEKAWIELLPSIEEIVKQEQLEVRGLMTMPPFFDDPFLARPYFQKLRRLQQFFQYNLPGAKWTELSMGTSIDYPIAIEEGATIIRVGQAITGPR
jgi:pyridoxal phosphate enzyme (YggS family)